ncbi:MAG: ferritin family protein [Desulfobacterales bacterium]|jgi:rubrerythrin|nr:ferritin family protein [Desulfobacteraceae bacterium]MBT7085513.1 ferritin family protein [Desulfobacterales bacterium]MBT7695994.1 ferritin family protein [Desulfobacterales bacterium]
MGHDFNVDEVFQMAEQIERNGAKFYRDAADSISDESATQVLLDLAKMEDEHLIVFEHFRSDLSGSDVEITVFDPEGEAEQYLRALADMRVFYQREINKSSLEEVYKEAILAEKDSIVFYLGMKELVPERLGKDRIDKIIKEEMKHIRLLGDKLSQLNK